MAPPRCIPNYADAQWAYYRFAPSVPANVVFVVLFGMSALLHVLQMSKTRTWYLSALIIGALAETIGYVGRVISALEDEGCWTKGPFIMQTVLLLVAPALMAASIYMILGRIILLTKGEHHALIRRNWLTKIFVTGDVLSFLMQSAGGGLMASAGSLDLGEKVVVGGLLVQLLFFGCFIAVAGLFHWRMTRQPTTEATRPEVRWKHYLVTLYVTGTLILIRSLFRLVEFIQGNDGSLMRSEVYIFIFDGLLMLGVLLWMNWFHPAEIGLLLRGDGHVNNGLQLFKLPHGRRLRDSRDSKEGLYTMTPVMPGSSQVEGDRV
jgi:hypothetical protein